MEAKKNWKLYVKNTAQNFSSLKSHLWKFCECQIKNFFFLGLSLTNKFPCPGARETNHATCLSVSIVSIFGWWQWWFSCGFSLYRFRNFPLIGCFFRSDFWSYKIIWKEQRGGDRPFFFFLSALNSFSFSASPARVKAGEGPHEPQIRCCYWWMCPNSCGRFFFNRGSRWDPCQLSLTAGRVMLSHNYFMQ